jgi:hypothetical protein
MACIPLEVFSGEVNEHLAHVYARLHGGGAISGYVRGPFNAFTETLPSTTLFRDLGPGDTRLGLAVVADPCTWSPQSPSTYQVQVESNGILHQNDAFGIRRFGVLGKSFYLDGKRWVIRGAFDEELTTHMTDWRAAGAVRVVRSISALPGVHEILRDATRSGVVVIVGLGEKTNSFPLKSIADNACSPVVVLPQDARMTRQHRKEAPNLLFAQRLEDRAVPDDWADAVWLEFTEIQDFARRIDAIDLPIIAVRRGHFASLNAARAAIDTLQADLAPIGQFAGYVV